MVAVSETPRRECSSATDTRSSGLHDESCQTQEQSAAAALAADHTWHDFLFYGEVHRPSEGFSSGTEVQPQPEQQRATHNVHHIDGGAGSPVEPLEAHSVGGNEAADDDLLQRSYDMYAATMLSSGEHADAAFAGLRSISAEFGSPSSEQRNDGRVTVAGRETEELLSDVDHCHLTAELQEAVQGEEGLWYMEEVGAIPWGEVRDNADADDDTPSSDGMEERFWWHKQTAPYAAEEVQEQLVLPDKSGAVTSGSEERAAPTVSASPRMQSAVAAPPMAKMVTSASYISTQDRLYLSFPTSPEARAPSPACLQGHGNGTTDFAPITTTAGEVVVSSPLRRRCVLVVFAANDLRVHDNYVLALASMRAQQAGPIPVVAVCVLDYRTFAQPSVVAGFYRQGPMRAQYLLDTVTALREKVERELHVPLLLRCGRPEEHVPRLAVELGAVDVLLTTQYAPHERRVHDIIMQRVRKGCWVSRHRLDDDGAGGEAGSDGAPPPERTDMSIGPANVRSPWTSEEDDMLFSVKEHTSGHPYGSLLSAAPPAVPHSTWQTTLVHLDDLPTPVVAMKEGERWYHDDVTASTIRPTQPYDAYISRLADLPSWSELLPTSAELTGAEPVPAVRGAVPTLWDMGYDPDAVRDFRFEEVIATQSSHPGAGETAALTRVADWLEQDGMSSMMRMGRDRRTSTKLYSQKLARVSPSLAVGALSPRRLYEELRRYTHDHLRDGFVQTQYREALLRLSRRDYWHWMGLRFGDRLFYSYGPHPEDTDAIPEWRHDKKIIQRWCSGLTGIPLADAAMRELVGTGFVAHEGRQALAWLLARGFGQDWRVGAEWLERCSLDYDPFVCYGNFAYFSELIHDDFGEPVRTAHYLAHKHDQTGIYVKKWLPQLSKVPPVYIHRPHVLTPRMQAMHGVYLGRNYPYPVKLWQGARQTMSGRELTAYFPGALLRGPGYAEALRHGCAVLQPEEWSAAVSPVHIERRQWAREYLPASAFEDSGEREWGREEAEFSCLLSGAGDRTVRARVMASEEPTGRLQH